MNADSVKVTYILSASEIKLQDCGIIVEYYPIFQDLDGSLSVRQRRDGVSTESRPDIIPERRSDAYTGETRQSGLERCKTCEMAKILQQAEGVNY